jgi:hypothetical protein
VQTLEETETLSPENLWWTITSADLLAVAVKTPGCVTDEQFVRLAKREIIEHIYARAVVETNQPIPILLKVRSRCSHLVDYQFDRAVIRLKDGEGGQTQLAVLNSKDLRWMGTADTLFDDTEIGQVECLPRPPESMGSWQPGYGAIEVEFESLLYRLDTKKHLGRRRVTKTFFLKFTDTPNGSVNLVDAPPSSAPTPVVSEIIVIQYRGRTTLTVVMRIVSDDVDVSADLLVRQGEQTWSVVDVKQGEGRWRNYSGTVTDFNAEGVADVVLRPNPDLAKQTRYLVDIWAKEIVVKDVPIVWQQRD